MQAVKECYGARIEPKKEGPKKAPPKKHRLGPIPVRPERKYDLGNTVSAVVPGVKYTNFIVSGYEWGGDLKRVNRDIWVYLLREAGAGEGAVWYEIEEDKIHGRISP